MYATFVKFTNTICVEIPESFFQDKGLININLVSLFDFFVCVARDIIDSNTRRTITRTIKILCAYFAANMSSMENIPSVKELIILL